MRLRNVKGASETIKNNAHVINNPKDYKGKIKTIFNNDFPIHLEIGMGKGKFIIENARKYPNINFIGIEKFDSVLVRALENDVTELTNLKFIRFDATEIEEIFANEIDTLYLNFSDPWPKNRHEHRRLTSLEFLKRYDFIFKDKKHIIMKTDNRKLFEFSVVSLTDYKYKIEKISLDLYNDDISKNIQTEYEKKFHNLGQPIYMIEVNK
ncbi:MAG: tRNA (guanosine(46)-N7)-methyltransferase TrmB [Mycoplasmatota bacterium]